MSDKDISCEKVPQHFCRNFSGKCAGTFRMHILGAELNARAFDRTGGAFQRGKGRADDHIDFVLTAQRLCNLRSKALCLVGVFVYFQVYSDQQLSYLFNFWIIIHYVISVMTWLYYIYID